MTISATFSDPLYAASGLSPDVPTRLPIALDGYAMQVDVARIDRQDIPGLRQSSDTTAEAGEAALSSVGSWRRHQFDWTGGAGQEYFDAESPNGGSSSDRSRFWKSFGVDPWTTGKLSLLHDVRATATVGGTNSRMISAGGYIYLLEDASTLRKYTPDSTGASAATAVTITGTPSDMTDICTDGYQVWISSTSNGVYTTDTTSGAASNVSANNGEFIRYANGRLFLGNNGTSPTLTEISAAGAVITTFTNPVAGTITWKDVAGAPGKIYVSLSVNGQGYLYRVVLNESTGSLQQALISAATLTNNEYVNAMVAYGNLMALGTSLGLRLATINTTGGLEYGAVITAPGEILDLAVDNRFVWFTWSDFIYGDRVSPYDDNQAYVYRSGVGRADLSKFTDTLVPAYAFDLYFGTSITVKAVVRTGGMTYFVGGGLLFCESNQYTALGVMNSGKMRFGVYVPKQGVSIDFRHDKINEPGRSVGNGTTIGWYAQVIPDDASASFGQRPYYVGSNTIQGSVGPVAPLPLRDQRAEVFQVEMYGFAYLLSISPLRRWSLVASPAPHRQEQITLPVLSFGDLFDENGPDEGQRYIENTAFQLMHLRNLREQGRIVFLQFGEEVLEVIVQNVAFQPKQWDDERNRIEGTAMVTLVTV